MPDVSSAFAIMAFFGAAWGLLYWFSTDVLAQWLAERRTSRLMRKANSLEAVDYASQTIRGKKFDSIVLAWLLLIIPTVPIFAAFVPLKASPYIYGGFLGATAILAAVNGRRWMRNFRIGAAKRISRFFLTKGKRHTIDMFLREAFEQNIPGLRKVAIESMGEWGSPVAIKLLKKATQDSVPEVSGLAKNTLGAVQRRLRDARPMHTEPLDTLFKEYEHWTVEAEEHAAVPEQAEKYLEKRNLVERRIEEILLSQMHLRNAFPDLFCMECHTRAEEIVHKNWRYVRCKTCKEPMDLHREIEHVIGRIGPMPKEVHRDGTLYLDLWEPKTSTSRPAEVEKIEVVQGGEFNYDWAVSSVAEAMQNRFPDQEVRLPVEFDEGIKLNGNTRTILDRIRMKGGSVS